MTDSRLLTQWAVCGIAAAAARFVPVPLLDDVIRRRAAQVAVTQTLRAHGRDVPTDQLEPLWAEAQGSRRRRRVRAVLRRVLLFPVRKYTALFGAVRGVPTDLLRVVLLARTVERILDRGGLAAGPGTADEAVAVRRAVDSALLGVDLRLLTAALADVLSHTRGLSTAAVTFARGRFSGDGTNGSLPADGSVAQGAARVTEVLERPDVVELLERFDSQVDAELAAGG